MYRITHVIASLRSKRGNLPNETQVFVDERLPRRFAPRNDVIVGWLLLLSYFTRHCEADSVRSHLVHGAVVIVIVYAR